MVEFVVRVPDDIPADAPLFLTGDTEGLGRWHAAAIRLDRWGDGTARTWLPLEPGSRIQYLITRGQWRDAECAVDGSDRPPRHLFIEAEEMTVELAVAGFGRDNIEYHPNFRSEFVPHARTISVYLPPGYRADEQRRYPVFYLHDGNNLFDAETAFAGNPWRADEVADREIRRHWVRPVILVGVANSPDRLHEYGPRGKAERSVGGLPDLCRGYAKYLVDEVKPFIDATYRTLPDAANTAVGGSSMGGLISLFLCRWHPEVFGNCAAMSPSLWWDREYFVRTAATRADWLRHCRVWLDMGGLEGPTEASRLNNLRRARQLADVFRELGRQDGLDFVYDEVPDGEHSEASWGERFDRMLRFLFPV